jgi:uncharacterized protein involved in response to NO
MNLDKVYSLACRLFFALASVFLAVAVLEKVLNLLGYTILRGSFDPGRLLEYASVLLFFVIALLLRQIRDLTAKT